MITNPSLLIASVAYASVSFFVPLPSLSLNYAGLTDDLGNASISVLSKLGYDCKTASVGIVCQKCQVEDNQQKCVAYLCDAITKKCRKKSAEIPKLPSFNSSNTDQVMPSA
jgi:hypothetical protein